MKGKIKRAFPGGNTGEGFVSLFDNIIGPDAQHVFIIKGGPGVGKATLMRHIGLNFLDRGYDIEFFHCSSDSDSLDAVVVPAKGIALIDGTAPHLLDPKSPGIVDEIINLGEYWDENILLKARKEIVSLNWRMKQMYRIAFNNLKEAKVIHDELSAYYTDALDTIGLNRETYNLCAEILADTKPRLDRKAHVRRLFASSNTPSGFVSFLETLLQDAKKIYLLKGEAGTGKEEVLQAVLTKAVDLGLDCEAYLCSLEPKKLEAIYIPALSTGLVRLNDRLAFEPGNLPGLQSLEVIDLNKFLDVSKYSAFSQEIAEAKSRLNSCFERAWQKLGETKTLRVILEKTYKEAMDFTSIDKKRDEILQRILSYNN